MNTPDIAKSLAEFAVPFAAALVKMKKAADDNKTCSLTAEEVKAVIEGFQLLNQPRGERH